jgi:sigma-B regulation protein RsbU (phosphoserine phosphatase)
VGVLDHGVLSYANAGHPYPMIYRAEHDRFVEIRQNGFLVGMLKNVRYHTENFQVDPDDMIFLYTDGLFCACEGKDFTGWDKVFTLSRQLSGILKQSPREFLEDLFYAFHMIHKTSGSDFTDDVAMMLLKVK